MRHAISYVTAPDGRRFPVPAGSSEDGGGTSEGDAAEPPVEAGEQPDPIAGEEALGDPGKKALDAMKAKWKAAEAERKAEADRAAALQAKIDGQEAEYQASLERQRVKDEALAVANERILKAEVRAAAAAKLADPADALKFLDLSSFEVDDDGAVDGAVIATAIEDLVKSKPYLAAQGSGWGSADQGARDSGAKPQITSRDELARMSPEDRLKAADEGRLDTMLGRTN